MLPFTQIFQNPLKTGLLTLTWKGEVGLDSFINFFTGIAVAVFLNHAYEKHINDLRAEKDLVIDQLKECLKLLREIRENFQIIALSPIQKADLDKIVSQLRQFSNNLSSTKDLIDSIEENDLADFLESIKLDFFVYKQIITGTKAPNDRYDSTDSSRQESNYQKISSSIHKLIIKTNRL